jgi:hypothetical protein
MEVLGYAVIALVLAGIFYVFWKILAQGFKAFTSNDD